MPRGPSRSLIDGWPGADQREHHFRVNPDACIIPASASILPAANKMGEGPGKAHIVSILIVGAGALGREVLAALRQAGETVDAFLIEPGYPATPVDGVEVIQDAAAWRPGAIKRFVVAIGDERARKRMAERLQDAAFIAVCHPAAQLGPRVSLGAGAMLIGPLSATTDIEIGAHALINPGCTIAHDCRIGAYASLGPAVALAGRVVVEEGASLGVGAVVAPKCRIGAWAVVGAGAAVVRDVAPGSTVVGVPARPLPAARVDEAGARRHHDDAVSRSTENE